MIKVLDDIMNQVDFNIPFLFKYVDDLLLAIPEDKSEVIMHIFNNYHPKLKFSIEIEQDNKNPFLDTLIIRENNQLITDWYRKPIRSDVYLNYHSHHPLSQKVNTALGLKY